MKWTSKKAQFMHTEINRIVFGGKLENAIVIIIEYDDSDIEGKFVGCTDPFIIRIADIDTDENYLISVLLHEMVHQYFEENCCDMDIDGNGEHSEFFKMKADSLGLYDGYFLDDDLYNKIVERAKLYDELSKIK